MNRQNQCGLLDDNEIIKNPNMEYTMYRETKTIKGTLYHRHIDRVYCDELFNGNKKLASIWSSRNKLGEYTKSSDESDEFYTEFELTDENEIKKAMIAFGDLPQGDDVYRYFWADGWRWVVDNYVHISDDELCTCCTKIEYTKERFYIALIAKK